MTTKFKKHVTGVETVYNVAIKSPLQLTAKLSAELDNHTYLKREDLQIIHSFKLRGAYYKIAHLSKAEQQKGIIAASAGNHAQGVALSAQKLGISATIFMPRTTPSIKVEAVRGYGAEIILTGDNFSDAYKACLELVESSGKTLIHPFDDPLVIAGQGTIGTEILEQLAEVTHIFVPVGGGGLIAGIAKTVKMLRPEIQIIGVEPDDSNAMQASLAVGERLILPHVGIFADGVAVKQVGEHTFALCKQYVDRVITVSNDQICAAIKAIYDETRCIVEPAGALAVAGVRAFASNKAMRHTYCVAICSGANMSFERLQFVAERTLLGSGKEALFCVKLPEQPGALRILCDKVVGGHNITKFGYRLASRNQAQVFIGIATADASDKIRFTRKLEECKYAYTDLSFDDVAKEHIRHMVGGPAPVVKQEYIFEFNFPERPGALSDFLAAIGNAYNISLFHYRGQGGDIGKVLIGFEAISVTSLERTLHASGYEFQFCASAAIHLFL